MTFQLEQAIAGARERSNRNGTDEAVSRIAERHGSCGFTCEDMARLDRLQLLAVIDQLLPDARRYQWLRDEETNTDPRYYPFWNECNVKLCRVDRMDALIDKWMSMDFCEHDNDAADCGICHGQFGVGA